MKSSICLLLLLFFCPALAHESCCKHKLLSTQPQVDEFIVDPTDIAPSEYQGQLRYIADDDDTKPEDWNDEDDGEWEPNNVILNPNYTWKPRMIPNPNFIPPPTYFDKFETEVFAALPWVVLGIFVTAIMNCLITIQPQYFIFGNSSSSSTLLVVNQFVFAAILGLATPLCSCGVLPVAASLVTSGKVPLATVMVFLTASQSAGLDSAMLTWGILGSLAVWIRLGGAILLALVVGFAVGMNNNTKTMTNKDDSSNGDECCPTTKNDNHNKFWPLLMESALEILPTILMGLALSTAVLHFVPLKLDQVASSSVWIRLGLLVSAIPLQLCEHTSVTLASAIAQGGGSPGLALAFLVSGPAVNMPTLLFLLQYSNNISGNSPIACVLRVVTILTSTALILSYALDYTSPNLLLDLQGDMPDLPPWYVEASPWIAGVLFAIGMVRRLSPIFLKKEQQSSSCCKTKLA